MQKTFPIFLIIAAAGCRDTEPPPTRFEDLGAEGKPLVPTAPVWTNPAIASGQADWYPFRDPTAEPVESVDDAGTSAERDQEAASGQVETEIRELVEEYNEVVRDGAVDEILEYFVAEQAAALKPVAEAVLASFDIIGKLGTELKTKLPGETERIDSATSYLLSTMTLEIKIDSVTVQSDTEATVTVGSGAMNESYRFIIIDDDWFMEVPGAETLGQLAPVLTLGVNTYREVLDGLQAGQIPPESALEQLETAATWARAAAQLREQPPSTEPEESANPDEPAETGD